MMSLERIAHLRREKGMTQSELAFAIGVSQSYIARIERGSLDPKLSIVNKIIGVLISSRKKTCSEIMTQNPVIIDARDPASQAVKLMRKHKFSQIPVLRGMQMIGMVTERDIIRNLQHDMNELSVQAVIGPEGVPIIEETTPVDIITPLLDTYQAILIHNQGRI
ncbi:helix-turn-helix domain-containing protein, partial [Candidatus Thorarchaeota archaeon]